MERLDQWLPDPAIRTHHRGVAEVDPDRLWEAAQAVRLEDTGALGRLVRWRIPGTPGDLTYFELFRRYPFTVLDEGEQHLVAGLAGRIWTLARDYPRLDSAEEFLDWSEGGTVRVAFEHAVRECDGGSELVSNVRVQPADRMAAMRLRTLWALVSRFERLIGAQGVRVAVRRAQSA